MCMSCNGSILHQVLLQGLDFSCTQGSALWKHGNYYFPSFLCLIALSVPSPDPNISWDHFSINSLHSNLCYEVCFTWNPNEKKIYLQLLAQCQAQSVGVQ